MGALRRMMGRSELPAPTDALDHPLGIRPVLLRGRTVAMRWGFAPQPAPRLWPAGGGPLLLLRRLRPPDTEHYQTVHGAYRSGCARRRRWRRRGRGAEAGGAC